ncbi:MAG: arsenic efflux protein [Bacteroidales bacterium]|nr:arsenic efflux protein [Bacteroidales bacterium]
MDLQSVVHIFKEALMITGFVLMMMLIIDYINVQTQGVWNRKLQQKGWLQIMISAFLGVIPGCLGAFTVVSLYTHRIVSFAALVAAMIATFGDEAFVMFAIMPEKALILTIIVFVTALLTGFFILFVSKQKYQDSDRSYGFEIHEEETKCNCFPRHDLVSQIKNISFERTLLITGFLLFIIFLVTGELGPEEWDWKRITFFSGGLITLFIVVTVPEHFLKEHLWGHVIKKHLPRIFFWTFGTFFIIHFIGGYMDISSWIHDNQYIILIFAVLMGIIPESGPHLIFITLFVNGTIPFSILIASSIVQDGHGALPLLAESRKGFIYMKLINILVGLVVGFIGLFFF